MPKELLELLNKIKAKKSEGKELLAAKKIEEAQAVVDEVKNLEKEYETAKALYEETKEEIPLSTEPKNVKSVDEVKAFFKAIRGEKLTDVENALVTGGSNGENLIVPQDIQTRINELRRQYKSARQYVGYYGTTTLTGSFVYEDITTINELTNFTDGSDVPASNEPKFTNVSYSVKEYGALLPVSNVLLQNEAGGLMDYIGNWFNKKAIRTENTKIFAQLKAGKTAKAVADWKALKKAINKDLDPAIVGNTVIITNQDGFDYLDSSLDGNNRPVLQPDPTNPTVRRFMGYEVVVFSNAELPTTGSTTKKAPIFFGDTRSGVTFVDRNVYEVKASREAGFTKNQTLVRVIEMFDVVDADKSAYVYGELDVTSA